MDNFMYLITALLWFIGKFIALGFVAFAGIKLGMTYRKSKNLKESA